MGSLPTGTHVVAEQAPVSPVSQQIPSSADDQQAAAAASSAAPASTPPSGTVSPGRSPTSKNPPSQSDDTEKTKGAGKATTPLYETPISVQYEREYFVSHKESARYNYDYNQISTLLQRSTSCSNSAVNSPNASFTGEPPNNQATPGPPPAQQPPAYRAKLSVKCSKELVTFVRYCENSKQPIELCYQCFGDPLECTSALLLVAGLNMQSTAFDEAFCELLVLKYKFFVVRFDNRDIGHSSKIENRGNVVGARLLLGERIANFLGESLPYHLTDFAKDAVALMDKLNIHYFHIMGLSMGGMICQCLALLVPERVLSMTSVMSTTNPPDLKDAQMWVKLWMLRSPPRGCTLEQLLDFRVASLRRLLERALPVDEAYLKYRYLANLRRSSYSAGLVRQAAAIRRAAPRDESLAKLNAYPPAATQEGAEPAEANPHIVPSLVVHGTQDLVVPPYHGYRTASVLQHSRILVLKSMGHYFHPAFFETIAEVLSGMAEPATEAALAHLNYTNTHPIHHRPNAGSPHDDGSASKAATPADELRAAEQKATAANEKTESSNSSGILHVDPASGASESVNAAPIAASASANPAAASASASVPQHMANMSNFFRTQVTVAAPNSAVGAAAIKLINVHVPAGGSPLVPEAVLVDLHDTEGRYAGGDGATAPFDPTAESTWNEAVRRRYPHLFSGNTMKANTSAGTESNNKGGRRLTSLLSPPPSLYGLELSVYKRIDADRRRQAAAAAEAEKLRKKKGEKLPSANAAALNQSGTASSPTAATTTAPPPPLDSPAASPRYADDDSLDEAELQRMNQSLVGVATDDEVNATALPPLLSQM